MVPPVPSTTKFETAAVKAAFGDHAYKLAMSSTKSMTGHLLGAAGAIEAIITARALQDSFIPATINYRTLTGIDLDIVPTRAGRQSCGMPCPIPWASADTTPAWC